MKTAPLAELDAVSVIRDGQPILSHVSLTLNVGERLAILGPNGSGKSTLIRLLYRFYEPHSGSIFVGGKNINDVDLESLRKNIAIVPQDSVLFHNTVGGLPLTRTIQLSYL